MWLYESNDIIWSKGCAQAHFSGWLPIFKRSHFKKKKKKAGTKGNEHSTCILLSKTEFWYLVSFMWIFLKQQVKKSTLFYLFITCSHSGNLTIIVMYQLYNYIHNEQTGVPHPRKALCLTIIIFHSENVPWSKYAPHCGFSPPLSIK